MGGFANSCYHFNGLQVSFFLDFPIQENGSVNFGF
jgi:hypothetical protein